MTNQPWPARAGVLVALFVFSTGAINAAASFESGLADTLPMYATASRIQYDRQSSGGMVTGHGTAFGVDLSEYGYAESRYMLTAAHNVRDQKGSPYFTTLKIELREETGERWVKVKVVAIDENLDICLLETALDLPSLAQIADRDITPGAPLVLCGSPRGVPVDIYKGSLEHFFHDGSALSLAQIKFDHGDSGGPVFCAKTGKVIGVAVAGVPKGSDLDYNLGLFIPLSGVRGFLEQHRRGPALESPARLATSKPVASSNVANADQRRAQEILDREFATKTAQPVQTTQAAPRTAPARPSIEIQQEDVAGAEVRTIVLDPQGRPSYEVLPSTTVRVATPQPRAAFKPASQEQRSSAH